MLGATCRSRSLFPSSASVHTERYSALRLASITSSFASRNLLDSYLPIRVPRERLSTLQDLGPGMMCWAKHASHLRLRVVVPSSIVTCTSKTDFHALSLLSWQINSTSFFQSEDRIGSLATGFCRDRRRQQRSASSRIQHVSSNQVFLLFSSCLCSQIATQYLGRREWETRQCRFRAETGSFYLRRFWPWLGSRSRP